jgi:hypothetical protein
MTILNLTNDGLPNLLVALANTLDRAKKPLTRTELLARVAPDGVVQDDGKMARQTLNRWIELGLFEETDEIVRLSKPLDSVSDEAGLIGSVRKAARDRALSEDNNPELWANVQAKSADFTRSVAWLLAQDVYRFNFSKIELLEATQVADSEARLMRNNTRQNGLKYWGHFLGFLREPGGGQIDPTCAIRETLATWKVDGDGMAAADFVRRLAEDLPVVDGGRWRVAVEDRLTRQALSVLAEGQLSSSLSRGLRNLVMEGVLTFDNRSDVGRTIVFTGRDGPRHDYRYSWVSLSKAKRSGRA